MSDIEERLAFVLHDEFWDDSVPHEEGETCCIPSARRILRALEDVATNTHEHIGEWCNACVEHGLWDKPTPTGPPTDVAP